MTFIKYISGFLAYLSAAVVVVVAAGLWWVAQQFEKPTMIDQPQLFQVERGSGLGSIAHDLADADIIEDPFIFMAAARVLNADSDLKAGEYEFHGSLSPKDVLQILRDGKTYQRNFTIPEGLTSYEVVAIIRDVPELTGEIAEIPEEGSLLPETYDYRKDESRSDVIARLQADMREVLDELWENRAEGLPLKTKEEALVLASIIEKETGKPEERFTVAGVFVNRLRKGMRLQTDPTVIYALHKGKPKTEGKGPLGRRLLKKDLEYDSPYNTYVYAGLPPGPIANPGRRSIEAALNPEEHDLIYFVADGTGGHLFAKTLAEHNRNVANWRKIRRAKR